MAPVSQWKRERWSEDERRLEVTSDPHHRTNKKRPA